MRALALSLVALAPALAAAAPPRPAIVVVPFDGVDRPLGEAGHAAALVALAALDAEPTLAILHPKQLHRTLDHHRHELATLSGPKRLERIASWLGANWVVSGTLEPGAEKVVLTLSVSDPSGKRTATKRLEAKDLLGVLDPLASELRALLVKLSALSPAAAPAPAPLTRSAPALLEYAACHEALIEQPIGIREPVVIEGRVLDEAIARCNKALELDPTFADVRAALGLAFALKGDAKTAEPHLASVKDHPRFLPLYALGKFWVLSRFYDPAQAVTFLADVVERHPGFLLARGYLGDTYNVLGRPKDALQVFTAYLEILPTNPWIMARIGYSHAKLGDHAQAIDWTKKALRLTPADSEILLEMSGRLVDAGRPADAASVLKRVVAEGRARAEVHLRLGYVELLLGHHAAAERHLVTALREADPVGEWRTRGRARYDLAKLWMKQGVPDNALRQLEFAVEEGFLDTEKFAKDPDLGPLASAPRFKALLERGARGGPKLLSPFPVDGKTGELTLGAPAAKPAAVAF